MKALVVEDDQLKRKSLALFFEQSGWSVKEVVCAADCIDEIDSEFYDILVLDVCIPWDGDDPRDFPDASHSNVVLKEIRRGSVRCPGFVVGITQDRSVHERVKEVYSRFGWICLQYELGQPWEELLDERVRIANNQKKWSLIDQTKKEEADIGICESDINAPEIEFKSQQLLPQSKALIMKGGGIKGLAYIGALKELQVVRDFDWFIGTSAGAITAVLLAAGYTAEELEVILSKKKFTEFFDANPVQAVFNLVIYHGMYKADALVEWLDTLLAEKLQKGSRVKMSDLPYRLTIFASQSGRRILTFDSKDNPNDYPAYCARCSMAIPFVFTPQMEQGVRSYDGGIQNNFPISAALSIAPEMDFFGLFLGPEVYKPKRHRSVIKDLLSIWTESGECELLSEYSEKIAVIDPSPVGTLNFNLSKNEKEFLLTAGRLGVLKTIDRDRAEVLRIQRDNLRAEIVSRARAKNRLKFFGFSIVGLLTIFIWYWLF